MKKRKLVTGKIEIEISFHISGVPSDSTAWFGTAEPNREWFAAKMRGGMTVITWLLRWTTGRENPRNPFRYIYFSQIVSGIAHRKPIDILS